MLNFIKLCVGFYMVNTVVLFAIVFGGYTHINYVAMNTER